MLAEAEEQPITGLLAVLAVLEAAVTDKLLQQEVQEQTD